MKDLAKSSINAFINRSQKTHFLLITFSVIMFFFGYVEITQVRAQKRIAQNDEKQYFPLQSYAQSLAADIRRLFIIFYKDKAQTEQEFIFNLISDISETRSVIHSIRNRIKITDPDVLPVADEARISRLQLNRPLNFLENILYFKDLQLSESSIGTFTLGDRLHEISIDDLSRLAFAISVNPGQIINRLSPYVSEKPLSVDEINLLNTTLMQLEGKASQEYLTSIRESALRLWKEWLTYSDSSLFKTAEISMANTDSLIELYKRTQSELDKFKTWEDGKKGVLLPGAPGKIPLEILIKTMPYVTTILLFFMILYIKQAERLIIALKTKNTKSDIYSMHLSYIQVIRSDGGLGYRFLVYFIRYTMILIPLGVIFWIGLWNPVLRKLTWKLVGVLYWLGIFLSFIVTIWFIYQCRHFQRTLVPSGSSKSENRKTAGRP